jgi:hypothetical protein
MNEDTRLCSTCGHVAVPARKTRGSFGIELVLWLCLLVPGLIYSIWRLNSRHDACAKCGATTLLPLDSPVARSFARANDLTLPTPKPVDASAGYAVGRAVGRMFKRKP